MPTEVNDTAPVIKKKSLYMKVKHTLDGLSVYVQSDVLEKFFKNGHEKICRENGNALDAYNTSPTTPHKAYRMTSDTDLTIRSFGSLSSTCLQYGKSIYYDRGAINLSILRVVGLTEGKEFTYTGMFPRHVIEETINTYKEVAQGIYKNLIVCYDVELTVNIDHNS